MNSTTILSDRFGKAFAYALNLHATQTRKSSTVPYIAHLMGVASIALDYGADEDEAIAALLHDAVEDQGGLPTLEDIRRLFGERVSEIVEGCSDAHATPKPPWKERKEEHIARMRKASASIRFVAACDKLHNAMTLLKDYGLCGESLWSRFNGGREGTLWYYREMAKALIGPDSKSIVKDLDRVVAELERLASP